ncbi:hypothetical protein P0100_24770 [Yersinia pestis]|nr:hypothetical protein [Yersinia pestis]
MSWSKLKQQLESFLSPALAGRVEYRATGYRYLPDKAGLCYISGDKKNVKLRMIRISKFLSAKMKLKRSERIPGGPFPRIVFKSLQEAEKFQSLQKSFCQHRQI